MPTDDAETDGIAGETAGRVSPADIRGLESAAPAETAAVAAAIGAHVRDQELAAAQDTVAEGDDSWTGRRWAFADRLARDRRRGVRIPADAPHDAWTAASRADRL